MRRSDLDRALQRARVFLEALPGAKMRATRDVLDLAIRRLSEAIAAMDPTRVMGSQFDLIARQHNRCAEFLKDRSSGEVKFDDDARTALALAAAFK